MRGREHASFHDWPRSRALQWLRPLSSPMVLSLSFILALGACGDDDNHDHADAGHDAAHTDAADEDATQPDAGGDELWEGCPVAADFVGPSSGAKTVNVTDDAVYCVMFNESQTFAEAYAAKTMLKIAPGSYALGTQSNVDVLLPMCLRNGRNTTQPSITTAVPMTYMTSTFEGQTDHQYQWNAPVQNGGGAGFLYTQLSINVMGNGVPSMTLDGREVEPFAYENIGRHTFYFCEGDPDCGRALIVDSCTFDSATLHRHTLALSGDNGTTGSVTFDLRVGQSPASTEPGAFIASRGTWDGQAFDQRDYFKLVYVPAHHHFQRNFIVLFDAPIGDVCGLRVSGISQYEEELGQGEAATVDCDLEDIAALDITDHTHMLVE